MDIKMIFFIVFFIVAGLGNLDFKYNKQSKQRFAPLCYKDYGECIDKFHQAGLYNIEDPYLENK